MGYFQQNGRYANTLLCTPFAQQILIGTTNGNPIELGDRGTARLTLSVTAVAGAGATLDVAIQTRRDAADAWRTVGAFTQATGVSSERKCFAGLDRFVRGVAASGGA